MSCPYCGSKAEPMPNNDHRNPLRCPECQGLGAVEDWYWQPDDDPEPLCWLDRTNPGR